MVLRKMGNLKYSAPSAGRNEEGSGWKGVVVIRSCRRPHVRKVA